MNEYSVGVYDQNQTGLPINELEGRTLRVSVKKKF